LSVKVRYPVTAMSRHAIKLIDVDTCVTAANLTRLISGGKNLVNEPQDSPIERGRVDALVDVHRVVVAHVGEGDHADSLENARSDYGQRSERRASEFLVHSRRAENDRGDEATLVRTDHLSRREENEVDDDEPKLDDLDSLTMSVCRLRGRDTQIVHRMMTTWRLTRSRSTACLLSEGMM
jgi:hypothetical protein